MDWNVASPTNHHQPCSRLQSRKNIRHTCILTRSKTSTFGLTYCQIEILQIRKKQNIKNKRTAHLQHSAVQFSTSTFAVHYSTIQYQHICSTVLNIYSTFQVTCTFAAHYSTIQHQYICSTLQYNSVPAYLQHSTEYLQHISAQLQHILT